jgi:hypothetical protein
MENKTDITGPERATSTKNNTTITLIWLALLILAGAFLVTMADEFERQPGLKLMLDDRYPQVSTQPGVWLYDLRSGAQN